MKKALLFIFIVLLVCGGGYFAYKKLAKEPEINVDVKAVPKLFKTLLANETKFTDEDGESYKFNEYEITSGEKLGITKKVYIDLDGDKNDELVILTNSKKDSYMIFHIEEEKVYGYVINIRSMQELKTDGTFVASSGADINEVCTISFLKNKYTIKTIALNDGTNKKYELNETTSTLKEVEDFFTKQTKKTNVAWEI